MRAAAAAAATAAAAAAAAAAEFGKPLALAQYFSKELSRHGKGALALLWFGNQVQFACSCCCC
jgi:hypothetical protein